MDIKNKLENNLKEAMRSKDEVRKRTLRLALATIKMAEIEKGSALDDGATMACIQKEVKSRHESISEAQRAGRLDIVAENEAEIVILQEFLPQPLSPEALEELVRVAIAEAGATAPSDMGKVMKILVPRLEGRARGNEASEAVRRLLQPK